MSAPVGPQSRSTSRGRGPSRASLRSRGSKVGAGVGLSTQTAAMYGAKGESRGVPRTASGAVTRGGRRSPLAATRNNEPQQHIKRPPKENYVPTKSWKNPNSLNAAFQSHAGKVTNSRNANWRNPPFADIQLYNKRMNDLYQTLKQSRERERKQAIKDGFLADPDKPTTLENAITPVGTCQDMCPEFERVERIVQLMIDGREKTLPAPDAKEKFAFEDIMVKRFRRSAAGYDEQLPSDIRPPLVLQKTLDYLFNDVVGGPEDLATVHKFVWDRTRSIRNDFSIQQVTKVENLKIAISCFERIARFHILSLHQLSGDDEGADNAEFDPYQEREQLNNTLLSLQYYYDDSRHKLTSPNEAEFRAYGIIFEIQNQRPDIEDRVQSLPKHILNDQRIQTALKLHAAAANTADEQGPLRPRTQFLIAQANSGGFWNLVQSNAVSYLMACVAEVYFNLVRRTALEAIWKAYKGKRLGPTKMEDWTLNDLTQALGFDDEAQTRVFCEQHDFTVAEKIDRGQYLDLGSVTGGSLTDQNPRRKQIFSKNLVEIKRLGRSLPAVINGMSASQAQVQGFVEDISDAETASVANSEPLFVDGESDNEKMSHPISRSPVQQDDINGNTPQLNRAATTPFNPFNLAKHGLLSDSTSSQTITFGKSSTNPFITKTRSESASPYNGTSGPTAQVASTPLDFNALPKFNPFAPNDSASLDNKPSSIGGHESPRFDVHAATKTNSLTENEIARKESHSTGPLKSKPYVFGQPLDANPSSIIDTKTILSQGLTPTVNAPSGSGSLFSNPAASSTPPTFSFGTSPLFGPGLTNQTPVKDNDESRSNIDDKSTKSFLSPNPTVSNIPPLHFFVPPNSSIDTVVSPAADSSKTSPTNVTGKPDDSVPTPASSERLATSGLNFTSSSAKSNSASLFRTTPGTFSSEVQQPPLSSLAKTEDLSFPKTASTPAQTPSHPTKNRGSANTFSQNAHNTQAPSEISLFSGLAPEQNRQNVLVSKDEGPGSRQTILNSLSDAVMLESKGLLEQFIEFNIEPIIKSSLNQLEDEDSWEEARKIRVLLLRRKYFKRWRANAWCISLMRKGRDRRSKLAKSAQELAESTYHGKDNLRGSFRPTWTANEIVAGAKDNLATMIPPPLRPFQKRQSLPAEYGFKEPTCGNAKGVKRKRTHNDVHMSIQTPRSARISHRRSQIIGETIVSAAPHGLSDSPRRPRMDTSKLAQGSMLHDVLMKQARRQIPTAKSDTTRTDYFRLKALGIDPDTPLIPRTEDRAHVQAQTNGNSPFNQTLTSELTTQRPKSQGPSNIPRTTASTTEDDDEALFAQIRSVREALAESEQWFQSERQSIERSATPQHTPIPSSNAPLTFSNAESPAQRKLREIKERGPMPSRTELRLRALGDKALLPEGFWDGEGMGLSLVKGKAKDNKLAVPDASLNGYEQQRPNGLMGSAAMPQMNGQSPARTQRPNDDWRNAGTSVEDAIEL